MREQFLTDPDEQIGAIESLASKLPSNPTAVLQDMMRTAHNIKGSAQIAGFTDFGDAVHEVETIFQTLLKHSLSESGLHDCMMLTRRLGTLLRKKFEALRDNTSEEHRDIAAWEVTVQGLTTIAANSPTVDQEPPRQQNQSLPADFDNWGLEIAPESPEPVPDTATMDFAQSAATDIKPDAPADEQEPAPAKGMDMSLGWGIFEDSEPANTPAPVKSPAPEATHIAVNANPASEKGNNAAATTPKQPTHTPTPTIKKPVKNHQLLERSPELIIRLQPLENI